MNAYEQFLSEYATDLEGFRGILNDLQRDLFVCRAEALLAKHFPALSTSPEPENPVTGILEPGKAIADCEAALQRERELSDRLAQELENYRYHLSHAQGEGVESAKEALAAYREARKS